MQLRRISILLSVATWKSARAFSPRVPSSRPRLDAIMAASRSPGSDLPRSSNVQKTLDPCVILMKEIIQEYAHLWDDRGGVLSLAQGVVYWDPPPTVTEALQHAIQNDPVLHTYGPDEGLPELRDALKAKLSHENGLHHHLPLVTVGANQAYMNVVLTLLSPTTSSAVVFRPYYFNHVMAIQLMGGTVVVGPCSEAGVPDAQWLEQQLQHDATISMVTITNPGNPTGVSLSRDQLNEYIAITKKYRVWLILDCTYEHFDHLHGSTTFECCNDETAEHVMYLFSFSKGHALAGFRCGYVVLHECHQYGVYQQMRKVQDTIPICPPRISQVAAMGAMAASRRWVLDQVQTLIPSRILIVDALSVLSHTMGGSGAMYVMGKLLDGMKDQEVCRALVRDFGIAIIPGSFCGFPGWIRVCYSNLPPEKCAVAAARLKEGLVHLCAAHEESSK